MFETNFSVYTGKALFAALFVMVLVIGPSVSAAIDWRNFLPHTCVDDLNYTLPETPIELNISIWVHALYDISEEKMEFGTQIELVEFWKDPYIKSAASDAYTVQSAHDLPKVIRDCVWKPDTVFKNAKDAKLYDATTANILYKVAIPSGIFGRRSRYKITASCSMKFEYYPMDVQNCHLEIALYSSRKQNVLMRWFEDPNKPAIESTPLNYEVKEGERTNSEIKYNGYTSISQCLQAHFLFERSLTASLFNIYIPSFLVVCLSMVSFWLEVDAVPGRITLGVTAILTLSTQIVQARNGLPVLNYMTAMDVWLLGCLVIVFLSLVEFTFANSFARRKCSVEKTEKFEPTWAEKVKSIVVKKTDIVKDNCLDRISRVTFPTLMVIFTSAYFFYYRYHI